MDRIRVYQAVLCSIIVVTATGCAAKEKKRITMLEDANRNLTGWLNQSRADLDAAQRDQQELNRRLVAALGEAGSLKALLAERPEPQEPAPGWTAIPGGAMIAIEGAVLFEPGRVTLRSESRRTLDGIVSTIQGTYSDKDILVFGHTDDQPIKKSGWADNYELSTERALAVLRYLRDHGVSTGRLVAGGCGEHRPRAANSSAANRAANRRVEIYAIDPDLLARQP